MSQVLYRKYRANSFEEIIGQEHIKNILSESIIQSRIAQSILLCGPRGTGKTSIARIFSKAVNCLNFTKTNDVCNECDNCLAIGNAASLDVIEMDGASNRGIEEIRQLKESINFLPNQLKYKIYIIDEAHMLTKEAFNALLKTLEEPPSHVMFILATTEPHKIPITILSRVQRYDLKLAEEQELIKKLEFILGSEKAEYEKDALKAIYKYSGGSFRDAESILGKVLIHSKESKISLDQVENVLGLIPAHEVNEFIQTIARKDLEQTLAALDKLNTKKNLDVALLIEQLISNLFDILLDEINLGHNTNFYTNLIKELIDSKKSLGLVQDKQLIFKLTIIKFINSLNGAHVTATESKRPLEIKQPAIQKEIVIVDKKEVVEMENDISTFIISKLLKVSPRLSQILRVSQVIMDGDKIVIFITSKFNYITLNKDEYKNKILQIVGEKHPHIKSIQVLHKAEETDDSSNKKSDNTNLVEELLS